jgi:hypothetical protein
MWNFVSVRLEIVLVSVQDRCTVCAKCTIVSEIVLDAPDGTGDELYWMLTSVRLVVVLT